MPGEHSITVSWDAVIAAAPEIVVVMPCGYDAPRAHLEALEHADALAEIGARQVVAVNASAYFSRPGPRLIDGLELLAHIFHPKLVPDAPAEALTVDLSGTANPTNDDGDKEGDEQDPGGEQNAGTVRTGARH